VPADQALFDLVIVDEASQITPWEAIGAMARGKQVVIAGDPRQMPPSNDFARGPGTATIDDDTAPDMESILDECLAAGVPQHSLDWHYRSRHESLITFSNARYYENKLVTFPSPDMRPSAVSWQRVAGVYTSGARTNPIEAQAIVDEAVRHLRDPGFVDERGEPLSLGIITMNAEQMRLIEDLLDKARRACPAIEPHFDAENRLEPVCIRNLETVQGDERDVILLGINFGPNEPAGKTMSMAFGKLNGSGGWRRLNVAATRARREMKVFTSFDPGMIDLTRTADEGVRVL
jgi:superfamily I DNA and/or RNA helicase